MRLERFSFGMGDRFGCQGEAQLRAVFEAAKDGIPVVPVWNKSHREHTTIGSHPADVRREADSAVEALGWTGGYYVDADHITAATVGAFLPESDFFTIDVADFIGKSCANEDVDAFLKSNRRFIGMSFGDHGLRSDITVMEDDLRHVAAKFLLAVKEAAHVYRHIASAKGADSFITEVSMDETDSPQTPVELFFILAALADEGVPVQTIAPKFSGRFNKGVDYVGDVSVFQREFEDDLTVIALAIYEFGLPANLKLSIHSGSDKFAIYEPIRSAVAAHGAGLHLKTAGTTWLEEVIGLASAGGDGLALAKEIYAQAHAHSEELTKPYATVIDIHPGRLPDPKLVAGWSSEEFAAALRHDPTCAVYNPHLRQLLHVGYKIAARMGARYLDTVQRHREVIDACVYENLLYRHLLKVFPAVAADDPYVSVVLDKKEVH